MKLNLKLQLAQSNTMKYVENIIVYIVKFFMTNLFMYLLRSV